MTTTTVTPAQLGHLPMSAGQILDAMDAGRLTRRQPTGFVWAEHRQCEDCGVCLPQQRNDGSADVFPRCADHAF